MTIGEKIKAIRKKKGLTQKELADACGMYDSAIRRYESNRQRPKLSTLRKIADALDVNVIELYDAPAMIKAALVSQSLIDDQAQAVEAAVNARYRQLAGYGLIDDSLLEILNLKSRLQANFDAVNVDGQKKIVDYSDDIASNAKYKNDKE